MTADFSALLETLKDIKPASAAEVRAYAFKTYILPRLEAAGVEDRNAEGVMLSPEQQGIFDKIRLADARNAGAIIALVGIRGTGKTTMASGLIRRKLWEDYQSIFDRADGKAAVTLYRTCFYHKLGALMSRLKSIYADFGSIDSNRVLALKERLCDCDLLILDELAEANVEQRYKDAALTDIVDVRYSRFKTTILISNQTAADFYAKTNDSILSRLGQTGEVIECDWPSYRTPTHTTP